MVVLNKDIFMQTILLNRFPSLSILVIPLHFLPCSSRRVSFCFQVVCAYMIYIETDTI